MRSAARCIRVSTLSFARESASTIAATFRGKPSSTQRERRERERESVHLSALMVMLIDPGAHAEVLSVFAQPHWINHKTAQM